jgi:ATP-dependent 26S proteasome regulatory subunit
MGIKFTFDSILNCLDGVYNNYKKTIFIMTANDIEKIDTALKNRPSRFKFLMEFDNPSTEIRYNLINDWAYETSGFNLDQIFKMKQLKESGLNLEQSLSKMNIEKQIVEEVKKDLNAPYI